MNTPAPTIALLIDADNINLSYTEKIIQFCKIYGTLKIKRAYGDWKQLPLSNHREKMIRLGVDPIQQNRIGKNATDFGLAMDAALMLDKAEATAYFLVSSDGDFTALCARIREKGAYIIGIGSKNTASQSLQDACHQYIDLNGIAFELPHPIKKSSPSVVAKSNPSATETATKSSKQAAKPTMKLNPPTGQPQVKSTQQTASSKTSPKSRSLANTLNQQKVKPPTLLSQPQSPSKSKSNSSKQTAASPKQKAASVAQPTQTKAASTKSSQSTNATTNPTLDMLVQACQKSVQKDGWISLSEIGEVLRKIDTKFNERFASKRLSTWFKTFPNKFHVEKDRVRMK